MSAALHDLGVAELVRSFVSKEVSSVEATTHLLTRATAHQHLGAWLCLDADSALAQARNADAMVSLPTGCTQWTQPAPPHVFTPRATAKVSPPPPAGLKILKR